MADATRNAQPHASVTSGLLPTRFLGQLPVIFEDPGIGGGEAAAGLLEPLEHLCRRVDLVVVPAIREGAQLVQIWGEPWFRVGEVDKAVLDHCGLRVHALGAAKLRLTRQALPVATPRAHDLVELRLIAGHRIEAFGNQLHSWISWVPEALSSIKTTLGRKRSYHAPRASARHTPGVAQYVDEMKVLARIPQLVVRTAPRLRRLCENQQRLSD